MKRRVQDQDGRANAPASGDAIDRRALFTLALPVALSACASAPLENFNLGAVPSSALRQPRSAVISIDEPSAPAILSSNRIAIRRPGGDYAYLSGAQWSDLLTQLVQRRLIQSFENAHLFQAVAETGTAADFILSTDIRRFEVDGETSMAVVVMSVRLLAARTGRTLRGTIVTGRVPAPETGASAITASLDAAFALAAEQVLKFAVAQT